MEYLSFDLGFPCGLFYNFGIYSVLISLDNLIMILYSYANLCDSPVQLYTPGSRKKGSSSVIIVITDRLGLAFSGFLRSRAGQAVRTKQ